MEYLECLQVSLQNHLAVMTKKSQTSINLALFDSAIILLAYFATWSRSKLYALAFLFVEVISKTGFLGFAYGDNFGFLYYLYASLAQCILFAYILSKTNSKSQRIICGMIVTIDVLMAVGYLTGGELALYLYNNYEGIVLCLHVCLILSLYKPKPIINAMVDGIRKLFRIVDDILFFSAIRYNQIRTMQMLRAV